MDWAIEMKEGFVLGRRGAIKNNKGNFVARLFRNHFGSLIFTPGDDASFIDNNGVEMAGFLGEKKTYHVESDGRIIYQANLFSNDMQGEVGPEIEFGIRQINNKSDLREGEKIIPHKIEYSTETLRKFFGWSHIVKLPVFILGFGLGIMVMVVLLYW